MTDNQVDVQATPQGELSITAWCGVMLLGLGFALIMLGFLMSGTVSAADSVLGYGQVNNIGKLNSKLMMVVAGGAFMICGSIFLARPK